MRDCYSPLKIFHHRSQIEAFRAGTRPGLIHVQLILTNRCNQDCEFCAYRNSSYPSSREFDARDQIGLEKALEIVTDCGRLGVGAVELTGGGEPTIYPHFATICKELRNVGIEYGIVTNGSHTPPGVLEAMRYAAWVRVSIDAADSTTYSSIRRTRPGAFYRARGLVRELKQAGGPIVGVGFVVTRHNWQGILQAAKNAEQDGADNFRVSAEFQSGGAEYFRDFYAEARDLCQAAKALEDVAFTVFNLFGDRIDDLRQQSPSHPFCPLQQLATYVGADLNVYRCCVTAYNEDGLLGSLQDRSLYELWHAEETAAKLLKFDARNCPRCMFNAKNATIRYAIQESPLHVKFL